MASVGGTVHVDPEEAEDNDSESDTLSVPAIAGGTVGAIILILLATATIVVIVFVVKQKEKRKGMLHSVTVESNSNTVLLVMFPCVY